MVFGDGVRLVEQRVGGHHPRHQAGALGLLGVHVAAGQDQVHRLGLADGAGQPLGAAHARQHAELDLGLAELRGVGGDQQSHIIASSQPPPSA